MTAGRTASMPPWASVTACARWVLCCAALKPVPPARANRRSINFDKMEVQYGDEPVVPFSFMTPGGAKNKMVCHITYTNEETHRIILDNIGRSPLYGGKIEGIGPRYCPSIEDKVMRFRDKPRHQIFVEPCGEVYR